MSRFRTKEEAEREMFRLILSQLSPARSGETFRTTRVTDSELFSHWLDAAILAMASLPSVRFIPESVRRRLRHACDDSEVAASLARLRKHGLISVDPEGEPVLNFESVTTETDRHHSGAKAYYRQVNELATEAIALSLEEREFQCFSLAISDADLPLYKQLLRNLRNQLERISDREPNSVYQVNLQLFPLTRKRVSHAASAVPDAMDVPHGSDAPWDQVPAE